jgi:hypothetical protein
MIKKMHKKDFISILYITVLTIAALIYGFMTIPSPFMQHQISMDHRRVSDLGEIKSSIEDYYRTHNQLPQTLQELKTASAGTYQSFGIADPETKAPYEYAILNQKPPFVQLCATFTTNSQKDDPDEYDPNNYDWQSYSGDYQHPAGHFCFKLNISYYAPTPALSQTPSSITPIRMQPLKTASKSGNALY